MKALYFKQHGGPEVLQYGDIPTPTPQPGEALVRVKAAALNHLDIWIRRGWSGLKLAMPHVTGADVSGVVEELHGGAEGFSPGDRVALFPGIISAEDEWTKEGLESLSPNYSVLGEHRPGGLAEYVVVPFRNLFLISDEQSFEEAAAPNLVCTTVWRMLFRQGRLREGETVLVVGAGGGVNSVSVQIAAAAGARVICLAGSEEKAEQAKRLGASETFLYKEVPDWHRAVLKATDGQGVDLVVDNVGEATFVKSLKALRTGGRLLTVGNTSGYSIAFDNRLIFAKQLSVIGSTMGSQQDLIDALDFMKAHKLQVTIDTAAPLCEGKEMVSRLESGKQFGKIVLLVD